LSLPQPTPADFLRAIFDDPESWVEIRGIEDRREGAVERTWLKREDVISNLDVLYTEARKDGKAVFFGVLPRIQGKGTSEDTLPSRVAWSDIDFKTLPEEEAWTRVLAFPIVPNIIVHSGHGIHLYWLLKEPVPPDLLSECSQRASLALGADHCFDAARILRMPGSFNLKSCWTDGVYTPDPSAPQCTIQLLDVEPRHSILEFLDLPAPPEVAGTSERTMFDRKADAPSSDMPAEVLKWLDGPGADPYLLDLFCSKGKVSGDCSNSGYNFSFAYKLAKLGIDDPDMLDAAVNCRPRTDGKPHFVRDVRRATDKALSEAIEFDEVGKDDAGGVRTFFEQRFPRATTTSGSGSEAEGEGSGEAEVEKSAERLAWEEAGDELSRIQKIVTEWEAKLPAATATLATTNSIRQQRRAALDRIKLVHKSQPLTPQQVHASEGVVAALEELSASKLHLATILEEDKHLFITRITVEEIAAQKEIVAAARRNVRIYDQNVQVAVDAAQAAARIPMLAVEQAALAVVEALEQGLIDAKNVFTTVKEGKGLLSKARDDLTAAKKAMQQAESLFVPSQEVQSQLKFSTYGEVLGNKYNVRKILAGEPYFKNYFSFDTFSGRLYYKDKVAEDVDEWDMAADLEGIYNIANVGEDKVRGAANAVGRKNSFHAVQRYLDGLVWDGKERVADVLKMGFGAYEAEGQPGFVSTASTKFLICLAARAFSPGIKMDNMLVLTGLEGVYKSTGLRILCTPACVKKEYPWFADTKVKQLGSREMVEQLQGRWLYELAEIEDLAGPGLESIKNALSSSADNMRMSYGRNAIYLPRGSAFVGTTNDDKFLGAAEGRRFVCVRVSVGDPGWLEENRDQIWAEATHLFRSGSTWWWEGEEKKLLARVNEDFKRVDPWASAVQKLASDKAAAGESLEAARKEMQAGIDAGASGENLLQVIAQELADLREQSAKLKGPGAIRMVALVSKKEAILKTVSEALEEHTALVDAEKAVGLESEAKRAFCVDDALGAAYIDMSLEKRGRKTTDRVIGIFSSLHIRPARVKESGRAKDFKIRGIQASWFLPPSS
jgi:predicted P-loop ATPase